MTDFPRISQPIAEGRTAELYPWGEGKVLKLYHTGFPPEGVEHETRAARAIAAAGLPVPAAGEIVEIKGRRGIVFERVQGV